MAAMLAAFARLVLDRPSGGARLVLACTVDEEFTFLGVQQLATLDLRGSHNHPIHAVIAEPTDLNIVDSHKGAVRWDLTTFGRSCHSSRPEQGVNAIYHMAELMPIIQSYAAELRTSRSRSAAGTADVERRSHRRRRQRQHGAGPLPYRDRPTHPAG